MGGAPSPGRGRSGGGVGGECPSPPPPGRHQATRDDWCAEPPGLRRTGRPLVQRTSFRHPGRWWAANGADAFDAGGRLVGRRDRPGAILAAEQ